MHTHVRPAIDTRLIENTYLLRRRSGDLRLLSAGTMVEPGQAYGSVLRDASGNWRMYYLDGRFKVDKKNPLDSVGYITRYSVSDDGIRWTRPDLGIVQVDGSRQNSAIMGQSYVDANGYDMTGLTGPEGFCVLDADEQDLPHVRGRFTAIYLSAGGDRFSGINIAHSDDGIRWTGYPENPVIPGWHDTQTCVFFDRRIGKYVAYLRPPVYSGPHGANRSVARAESDDLINWTIPRIVLDVDDRDADAHTVAAEHNVNRHRGRDRQWYGMTAFPYQELYLGFGWMYDVPQGSIQIDLLHSYDGIDWRREVLREPFVGHGRPAGLDATMICTVASPPVDVGDEHWIYLSTTMRKHSTPRTPETIDPVMRGVAIARDRWVGYQAGEIEGELLTTPFAFQQGRLLLNAQVAEGGYIKPVFCDEMGRPLSGNEIEKLVALDGPADLLDHPVAFLTDTQRPVLRIPTPNRVRLRFQIKRATLYSWTTVGR